MALTFQDPPPLERVPSQDVVFLSEVRELVANPERWAILTTLKDGPDVKKRASSVASNVKAGNYAAFRRAVESTRGSFQTAVRGGTVYVRFMPYGTTQN